MHAFAVHIAHRDFGCPHPVILLTNNMATTSIATIITVSSSFPQLPGALIPRPQYIDAFETELSGPASMVVIEGDEGAGKTTLAAQFALTRPDRTFSLFVSGLSAFSRSPELLLWELCDQIHWFLHGTRMAEGDDPERFLRESKLLLQRRAVREKLPFYFVIDGLLELADADPGLISLVLTEYLPLGVPGFKFLLTGPFSTLPASIRSQVPAKPFPLLGFTFDEAKTYFEEREIDPAILTEIYRTFKLPGKLASIKRILTAGVALELGAIPTTFADLFTLEWNIIEPCSQSRMEALSLLGHSRHELTISDLCRMTGADSADFSSFLRKLQFIVIDDRTQAVNFVSTSFKRFAASKLSAQKDRAIDMIIADLYSRREEQVDHEQLPRYLELAGRARELVDYLTPEYLSQMADAAQSISPVNSVLDIGIHAASELKLPVETARFTLQRAALHDVAAGSVLGSEIEARLSLGEEGFALALAQRASLKEHRLALLAKVASYQRKKPRGVPSEVIDEIRRLVGSTDFRHSPALAVEIGSDLVFVDPEIAIKLVEAATGGSQDYPMDVALANLSIFASDSARTEKSARLSSDAISEKIANPTIREDVRAISSLIGRYSEEELLQRCGQMKSAQACVSVLERWAVTNPHNPNAWKVIDYALDYIFQHPEYIANAATFRRLGTPLPFVASEFPFEANRTLQRFLSQLLVIQGRGPSVEYVRLELLLAETEATWDSTQAFARVERGFYTAIDLQEADRSDALAWILRLLTDRGDTLSPQSAVLTSLVEGELSSAIDAVLAATASHDLALRGLISALVPARVDLVMTAITKVNTRERRDASRWEALTRLLRSSVKQLDFVLIMRLISEMEDRSAQEDAVYGVMRKLDSRRDGVTAEAKPLLGRCMGIQRAPLRVLACSLAYAESKKSGSEELLGLLTPLRKEMDSGVELINSAWDRIDICFAATTILADTDQELARRLLKTAEETRRQTPFADQGSTEVYTTAVDLAVRAFVGVAAQKLDVEESLGALKRLISRIPSEGERARLWGAVAERCFCAKAVEVANRICDGELTPSLDAIADTGFVAFVLVDVAPALFRRHTLSAIKRISQLDYRARNDALAKICHSLITGHPSNEPVDQSDIGSSIDYQTALDVVECLRHCDRDYTFTFVLIDLCKALASERGVQTVTKGQRAEIDRLVSEIVTDTLPAPFGIQHGGYKILACGGIALLRSPGSQDWEGAVQGAVTLPNLADQAFTLAVLASIIPARCEALRAEAIEKARSISDQIAIPGDKIGSLELVAQTARRFDVTLAKQVLQNAFRLASSRPGDRAVRQDRMIDLAYRLDPKFAESLVSSVEDDPAHVRARLSVNQVRGELRGIPSAADLEKLTKNTIGDFGWSMLSGLNAGRVSHIHMEDAVPFIERAGSEMDVAYPVLSWIIQNSVVRYAGTGYGATHLVELFNSVVFGCELVYHVISNASCRHEAGMAGRLEPLETIGPGEYQKAVERIQRWLNEVAPAYLKISDPYLTPDDIELLKWIRDANPSCRVQIVAGEKKHKEEGITMPYEAYGQGWRSISAQEPPETTIVIAGIIPTGECPIHERWLVSAGKGLRLGTSLSGLGQKKESEITELSEAASWEREAIIDRYLSLAPRNEAGDRIRYGAFSLP